MTRRDIVERLRLLRISMERQADGTSILDLCVPVGLVLFDVLGALDVPTEGQVYVLGAENAARLWQEYGIEWEEV